VAQIHPVWQPEFLGVFLDAVIRWWQFQEAPVSGARFWGALDSQAVASIMRPAPETKGAFGNLELTNANGSNVSGANEEPFPDFPSSELNTHIYEHNP
jgi:hypothetical protein